MCCFEAKVCFEERLMFFEFVPCCETSCRCTIDEACLHVLVEESCVVCVHLIPYYTRFSLRVTCFILGPPPTLCMEMSRLVETFASSID